MNAHQIVEAVLFAADAPLTAGEIARADELLDEDQVEDALQFLRAEYDDAARAFQIVELAEGHQIVTRPEFAPYLERFDNVPRPSRLSGPALETLAIIAYRQPIGRLEVEYVRGVGAAGVIRTLQERELIDVVGRSEGLGRPILYGTTRHFLEHFGFRSVEDLPRPEELPVVLRERIPLGPEELVGEGEESLDGGGERPAPELALEAEEPALALDDARGHLEPELADGTYEEPEPELPSGEVEPAGGDEEGPEPELPLGQVEVAVEVLRNGAENGPEDGPEDGPEEGPEEGPELETEEPEDEPEPTRSADPSAFG